MSALWQHMSEDEKADQADAFEDASRTMYFDAMSELSRDGHLQDATMLAALDELTFSEDAGGIVSTEVLRLVGELHNVSSLDRDAVERAHARIGKYVASIVERNLAMLVDAKVAA